MVQAGSMTSLVIASDMDGTLLNQQRQIPERFWPVLKQLHSLGAVFAPASGRQLYTLLEQFEPAGFPMSVIAENGTVVYHEGEIVSLCTIEASQAHAVIEAMESQADQIDWGLVLCRADGAFVTRRDEPFLAQCQPYYARMEIVDDLHAYVDDQVVKLAIYSFADAESIAAPKLRAAAPGLNVVVSGAHWVDIMDPAANKGKALEALAQALGVPMEDTIAFGDYLNDTELLQSAGKAYAMENAHPHIKEIADALAPSNADEGVVEVLRGVVEKLRA
ncbi:Sugar phosphatase YbiV [Corynebacterium pelargi]|uniref:Sugar phosphatase YbiV n=2 Tax=Corynebacterium pelargi TaxID=1471400 RepID=A0A410W9W0_9CORY|nr:Sugar phosphatase YbiV [Corynebacterium pelargi]